MLTRGSRPRSRAARSLSFATCSAAAPGGEELAGRGDDPLRSRGVATGIPHPRQVRRCDGEQLELEAVRGPLLVRLALQLQQRPLELLALALYPALLLVLPERKPEMAVPEREDRDELKRPDDRFERAQLRFRHAMSGSTPRASCVRGNAGRCRTETGHPGSLLLRWLWTWPDG